MRMVMAVTAALCLAAGAARAQAVAGRITIKEKDNKPARDLGNAVVWLEGPGPAAAPDTFDVLIADKTYVPRVLVIPAGSTVRFPNRDPFNHNVFFSDSAAVDLGLYGRGQSREHAFRRAGLVRVFCNVHPRMVAYITVAPTRHIAQAGADGSFRLDGVAPGRYRLRVWHERVAGDSAHSLTVPPAGLQGVQVALDASGYRWQQHKNKTGQDYGAGGRRERY